MKKHLGVLGLGYLLLPSHLNYFGLSPSLTPISYWITVFAITIACILFISAIEK